MRKQLLAYVYVLLFPAMSFCLSFMNLYYRPYKWRKYLPFLIYTFFIGAYVFESHHVNFDLIRYIPEIEAYGKLSLVDAFQRHNDILYARDIMFWLFGSLGVPHMVPAVSTASVYAIAFYITCDTAERYNAVRYISFIVAFQISMLPYLSLINNVRNVFALSLIILAVYLDIVKKKFNGFVIFCYVFGCLMHLSAFVLIIVRILSPFAKKIFGFAMALPLFFSLLVEIIYKNKNLFNFVGEFGGTINSIIWKLYIYTVDHTSPYAILSANSITLKFDRTVMTIGMILALLLVFKRLHSKEIRFLDDANFFIFMGGVAICTLSLNLFVMPNFWRFSAAFYTAFGVIVIPYILRYNALNIIFKLTINIYAILGGLCLLMQFWRCTWFDFGEWLVSFLTTNVYTILFEVIRNVFGG